MISHHSSAILMCERAAITDPQIIDLCEAIVSAQEREITEMRKYSSGESSARTGMWDNGRAEISANQPGGTHMGSKDKGGKATKKEGKGLKEKRADKKAKRAASDAKQARGV